MTSRSAILLSVVTAGTLLAWQGFGFAESGLAALKGTDPSTTVSGTASFEDLPDGLAVTVQVSGLAPGKHAIHIHEFGDCGDSGKAAGSHYNPSGVPHGFRPKDGASHAHPGDMGNLEVDANGMAVLNITLPGVELSGGTLSVAGRTVIIHANEDDFSQPTGNAGDRVACGEILITKSSA